MKNFFVVWFAFALSATAAHARECSTSDTTNVYFVNGVHNTFDEASLSAEHLSFGYGKPLRDKYPEQSFEFKASYNYHAGYIRDLLEVLNQKITELNDPDISEFTAHQYAEMYQSAENLEGILPPGVGPIWSQIDEFHAARLRNTIDASRHVQKYRADLQEGKRVLLFAHSQGNMFANQSVRELMNDYGASMGMIGVASPAALTYNNSPYHTAHDDRVIDALRLLHNVLPSNIDNDPGILNDNRDFANHSFVESYFDMSLNSRSKIDDNVYSFMESLIYPTAQLTEGVITVTLEWGNEPDVDLHVTEPNGTHVYYRNKSGISGYLDLDDTSGNGPEHYYASCQGLETGTYEIGLNYFSGVGPETAQVQIATADGNTRSFSRTLTEVRGTGGNDTPIPVATVTVTEGDEGQFTYTVN